MTTYLIRRLIQMFLVLILSSITIFALLNLMPGGPLAQVNMSSDKKTQLSAKDIENLRHYYGLDKPMPLRYVAWLLGDDWMGRVNPKWQGERKGIVRGDLGRSWAQNRPVLDMMKEPIPNTLRLMLSSAILSMLIAIPAGIYSAVRQYSKLDYSFTFLTFIGTAIPAFWFGLMMIIVLNNKFQHWHIPFFPSGGTHSLRAARPGSLLATLGIPQDSPGDYLVHLVMPVIMLSLLYMAGWGRFMRSSMLEVLRQDYVRTARSKGLAEKSVIVKHALRNALIPLVTIVTFELPAIFGGAILTESVFAYPGMGRLYLDALGSSDYPVVQGYLVFIALLVIVATLLSDLLYTVVDPRIRFS